MTRRYRALSLAVRALRRTQRARLRMLGALVSLCVIGVAGLETGLGSVAAFRERAAAALSGNASFALWNGRVGVPVDFAGRLSSLPGVVGVGVLDWASAKVQGTANPLLLIGLATEEEERFLQYELALPDLSISDAALQRGLFLPQAFVARAQLRVGQRVRIQARGQSRDVAIAGTIAQRLSPAPSVMPLGWCLFLC